MKNLNNLTCYEYLNMRANELNERIAVEFGKDTYNFAELIESIDFFANQLINASVKKNDVCTVLLPNCPQLIIAFYAINKIGAIANILFVDMNKMEILEKLRLNKSTVLISTNAIVYSFDELPKQLNTIFGTSCVTENKMNTFNLIKIENTSDTKLFNNYLLLSETKCIPACIVGERNLQQIDKQVVLSNQAINNLVYNLNNAIVTSFEEQKILSSLNMFTVAGLILSVHWTLSNGWTCVIKKEESSEVPIEVGVNAMIVDECSFKSFFNNIGKLKSLSWVLSVNKIFESQNDLNMLIERGIRFITALSRPELCSVFAIMQENDNNNDKVFKLLPNTKIKTSDNIKFSFKFDDLYDNIAVQSPSIMSGYLSDNPMEYNGIYINKYGEKWLYI